MSTGTPAADKGKGIMKVGAVLVALGLLGAILSVVGGLFGSFAAVDADGMPPQDKAEVLSMGISVAMYGPFVGMAVAAIGGVLILVGVKRSQQK